MQVAELFVRYLENEGVRYVFGGRGEELDDLLLALEDSTIQFVPTRNEQRAALANVWGRPTLDRLEEHWIGRGVATPEREVETR